MKVNLKSQVSFMLGLTSALLTDVSGLNQVPSNETKRDVLTLKSRSQHECAGLFTKTLPLLGKAVDSAMLSGTFQCPTTFKRYKSTALPAFLRGLLERVFREDGVLREGFDAHVVRDIRQICYLFYKYQIPHKPKLVAQAFLNFQRVDKDIRSCNTGVEEMSIIHYAKEVIDAIFENYSIDTLRPANGPGSVANGIKPWERFKPTRFYPSLDKLVSYSDMYCYSDRHLFDCFHDLWDLDVELEGTAKCIAVPKDSRGPRLISAETSEFMTYQQALKNVLVPYIESHWITGGRVNFTDQTINGNLAMQASIDQKNATIDLKEASDRLSLRLVEQLFEDTPIKDYILLTRSTSCCLPSGGTVTLNKFAPMGSALCFPIQSLCYYAICVGYYLSRGEPLNVARRCVYVYGDDIIVPTDDAVSIMADLETVGLKVNRDKSCYSGKFRESCGVDAYAGVDITPVKLKKLYQKKRATEVLISYTEASNNMFERGYWKASDFIRRRVERNYGKLPVVTKDSPAIGWTTWSHRHAIEANESRWKWDLDLHQRTFKTRMFTAPRIKPAMSGWEKMMRDAWERPEKARSYDDAPFTPSVFTPRRKGYIKTGWVTETSI